MSEGLLPPLESAQGTPVITLVQLARFLRRPVGAFFRERLQVHLDDERTELHDDERFTLDGLDPANANSLARYIYIHGTNQERLIGRPASHGCVRLRNKDMADLYKMVRKGSPVRILASGS